jgi:Flp pilus assembly protein CpaB
VALLLCLITSFLVFTWLQNEKNRLMAAPIPLSKNVQVLVSNADLSWGTKLAPEMMQLQEFPSGAIPWSGRVHQAGRSSGCDGDH